MIRCWKSSQNLRVLVIKFLSIDQVVLDRMDFKNLVNLCLKGDCNSYYSEELDISSIFKLAQLKYLSLVRIIFAKNRELAKPVITNFAKLANLTFLNLCKRQTTQIIAIRFIPSFWTAFIPTFIEPSKR